MTTPKNEAAADASAEVTATTETAAPAAETTTTSSTVDTDTHPTTPTATPAPAPTPVTNTKVKEDTTLTTLMTTNLTKIQNTIRYMNTKRGRIFIDWLDVQNKYLNYEVNFDPMKLKAYKRGEIIRAHFGFNVGNEFGGVHYAVVLKDSSKGDHQLAVVPLSSLEDDEDETKIHHERVLLGVIDGLNAKRSVAIPNQIRSINKLRVISPRKDTQPVVILDDDLLDKMDDKLIELFTKPQKNEEK